MISIDRDGSTPIFEQLARQLRYLIATGHFRGRKSLPSTRALATSIGVSFHTVRRAYQELQREGILEAEVGSGYRVRDPSPLNTSERIEQGAAIVEDTLHRLAGLGLGAPDIEYLVEERLGRMRFGLESPRVIFASASREIAAQCAADVSAYTQCPIEPAALSDLARNRDAEYALSEFRHLAAVRKALPASEALGVATHLSTGVLDRLSRMLTSETVGLLTLETETVRYLTERIKFETRFTGQILATASAESLDQLAEFAGSVDLLIYTPALSRRVRRMHASRAAIKVTVEVDAGSKREVLEALPSQ